MSLRVAVRCGLALLGALIGGCDGGGTDDASVPDDAMPDDAMAAADSGAEPADAGETGPAHCLGADLFIEAFEPGTSVTLFNPTAAPIDSSDGYVFCQQPIYPAVASLEADVVIGPNERHVFPWPSGFTRNLDGGEIALYRRGAFLDPESQLDFICWGTGHSPSRKNVAEMDGDWIGDCAGPITGASMRRLPDTEGGGADDYDVTGVAEPLACP
ncbi:MAG: hypothetical protein RLP09_09950 [Sandaracinaceae bacterium]